MSDFQTLVLVLWALYLLESLLWLPDGFSLLRRRLFGDWRVKRQGWNLPLFQSQIYLAPLFPPFGRTVVTGESPLRLHPAGFRVENAKPGEEPNSGSSFKNLKTITADGRVLQCNGQTIARFGSPWSAQRAANFLLRLKAAAEPDRPKMLETEFQRMLDVDLVQQRLIACGRAGRRLHIACYAEFTLLLVALPLLGQFVGFRVIFLPVLFGLLALGGFIVWEFHRAYGVLYESRHPNRGSVTAVLLLSPLAAARSLDQLTEPALSDFHPLAVAGALATRETFFDETARYLREWRFPLSGVTGETDWHRTHWQRAIEQFVARHFNDPARLLAPPSRESEECLSFCPRCGNQYRFEAGQCADCMLPVFRFDEPAPPAIPN